MQSELSLIDFKLISELKLSQLVKREDKSHCYDKSLKWNNQVNYKLRAFIDAHVRHENS